MISVIPVKWSSRGSGTGILLYCLTIHAICLFKGAVGPDFSLTVSTFFYCRRPFFVLFSLPSCLLPLFTWITQSPFSSLLIPLFSSSVFSSAFLSTYSICCFFIQFLQNHHHFSLSSSSISFFHSALPLIFSHLCFSPTHHHLNKPCLLPSLTIINRFGLRASMFFFCSSWGARGHINTKASKHCVSVLMHGNSSEMERF